MASLIDILCMLISTSLFICLSANFTISTMPYKFSDLCFYHSSPSFMHSTMLLFLIVCDHVDLPQGICTYYFLSIRRLSHRYPHCLFLCSGIFATHCVQILHLTSPHHSLLPLPACVCLHRTNHPP